MLQLSQSLLDRTVLSLRTGAPIATTVSPLINPNNLKVEGLYCQDRFNKGLTILLCQDIRETLPSGFVVNDHEVLTDPSELVRLKNIIDLKFELIGKPVMTVGKDKVGKVSDYAVEAETMYIQKIYVGQSLLKSFTGGSLSIDRSQIYEITNKRVIINDLLKGAAVRAPATI